jgi:hypothetical protein
MNLREGLDWKAQSASQELVNKVAAELENLSTKALGVLQEAGIYAVVLFFHTRGKEERQTAERIMQVLDGLALQVVKDDKPLNNFQSRAKYYTEKICSDLHATLMTRAVWEQTLIYARYGAKAVKPAKPKTGAIT